MFVPRAAQLQKGSSRVTRPGRARGWPSTIGAPVLVGCSRAARSARRASGQLDVDDVGEMPELDAHPTYVGSTRERDVVQEYPMGRDAADDRAVVSELNWAGVGVGADRHVGGQTRRCALLIELMLTVFARVGPQPAACQMSDRSR
jgi:hypothetical protein